MLTSSTSTSSKKAEQDACIRFPANLALPRGKTTLLVTLIGSADVLVETKPEDRPIFEEDLTEEEREAIAKKNWEESQSQSQSQSSNGNGNGYSYSYSSVGDIVI